MHRPHHSSFPQASSTRLLGLGRLGRAIYPASLVSIRGDQKPLSYPQRPNTTRAPGTQTTTLHEYPCSATHVQYHFLDRRGSGCFLHGKSGGGQSPASTLHIPRRRASCVFSLILLPACKAEAAQAVRTSGNATSALSRAWQQHMSPLGPLMPGWKDKGGGSRVKRTTPACYLRDPASCQQFTPVQLGQHLPPHASSHPCRFLFLVFVYSLSFSSLLSRLLSLTSGLEFGTASCFWRRLGINIVIFTGFIGAVGYLELQGSGCTVQGSSSWEERRFLWARGAGQWAARLASSLEFSYTITLIVRIAGEALWRAEYHYGTLVKAQKHTVSYAQVSLSIHWDLQNNRYQDAR